MDQLKSCEKLALHLDKQIAESNARWKLFLASQSGYKSSLRCDGKILPPPVMTAEKRRKMLLYKKQAYIVEVRVKSRSRDKALLNTIQGALDQVRDNIYIDTSESLDMADCECVDTSFTISSQPSSDKAMPSHETPIHQKQNKAKSTTDISKVGKTNADEKLRQKGKEKRKRRRYNSEGKPDCESQSTGLTKPCQSNNLPSHSKKWHSSGNLLAVPFERYEKQVESEKELSKPRQRYREERAQANTRRTSSPQPPQHRIITLSDRPASTPPGFSVTNQNSPIKRMATTITTTAIDVMELGEKQKLIETKQIVSRKALKSLLDDLDPCSDQPTHQWLSARVSDQEKNKQEDISLEDWFQNAPDSVKQKLASLLPKVPSSNPELQHTDDGKVVGKSVDIQVSPIHTCNSSDDTLRSTSPIAEVDQTLHCESLKDYPTYPVNDADDIPLLVIEKSPSSSQQLTKSLNRAESCTVLEPSSTSMETVIEVDTMSKLTDNEPSVPPLDLEDATISDDTEDEADSDVNVPNGSAGERRRTLSMQSYTVDEPSEALINFTLNSTHESSSVIPSRERKTTPNRDISGRATPNKDTRGRAISNRDVDQISVKCQTSSNTAAEGVLVKQDAPTNVTEVVLTKPYRSKIPTASSAKTLLSKCHFDTPSPVVNAENVSSQAKEVVDKRPLSTPVNTSRHRQFVRLINQEVMRNRSLTPTPPSRAMTPTPPSRPKSVLGTRWTRSRSLPQHQDTKDVPQHQEMQKSMSRRLKYAGDTDSSNPDTKRGSSKKKSEHRHTTARSSEKNKKQRDVKRSAKSDISKEDVIRHNAINIEESPLKDYEGKKDKLIKARKQLALLKSKFLAISGNKDVVVESHVGSAESTERVERLTSLPPVSTSDESVGKENAAVDHRPKSVGRTYKQRDERPVVVTHSPAEESKDICSVGNILSISHKTNRVSSLNESQQHKAQDLARKERFSEVKSPLICSQGVGSGKLHAVIKGHLCRKLFKCSKVKSIVKTIQDCRNLLPSISLANSNSAIQDVNFQQKLKLQMAVAKSDLHDIFFSLPTYQRVSLIKQSEMVLARHRLRQQNKIKTREDSKRSENSQQPRRHRKGDTSTVFTRPRIHTTSVGKQHHVKPTAIMKPVAV